MHFKYLFCSLLLVSCNLGKPLKMSVKNPQYKAPQKYIRPANLEFGDSVAILAPAGLLKGRQQAIESAQDLLKSWGLVPVLGVHLFNQNNHFAGTDTQRFRDFQQALDTPEIRAIWCARGGYGTMRIADNLNFEGFKKSPKWLIGYSDITVLHNKVNNLGYETLHAMMAVNMEQNKTIENSIASLKAALFGNLSTYSLASNKANRLGDAKGVLIGGNLTLLTAQLGSVSQLDTRDKILFIEEIGEYKYHIDRMMQSLKRAGYFEHCAGVVVGDMIEIKSNSPAWGSSTEALIMEVLKNYEFPVAFGIPSGHAPENRALIFGRSIELSVSKSQTVLRF